MKYYCFVGVLFASLIIVSGYSFAAKNETTDIPSVTLTLTNVKVDEIVKNVSKQVGYTVYIEGQLKDDIVSGIYDDISLDNFFHRIFKKKNVVVDIDTQKKIVVVHLFGSSGEKFKAEYVRGSAEKDPDAKLALSDVKLSELEEIFAEEERIYQEWHNDPNATIPFTSVTKSKYEETIEHEAAENQKRKSDPERKLALSSLKHSEAMTILEREGKEDLLRKQDPDTKIALSDMTLVEYKRKVEGQEQKIQQAGNGSDGLIPFSNVTYSEFHEMNSQ